MTTKALNALTSTAPRETRQVIHIIVLLLIALSLWASVAEIGEVVRGTGKIAPRIQTQLVQNLEGGIVEDIFVAEGDVVSTGQLIAQLDQTEFSSAFQELMEQQVALEIRLARLEAEQEPGTLLHLPDQFFERAPEITKSEENLLHARAFEYQGTVATLTRAQELRESEVDLITPIVASNALPRIELIRAEQALADAQRNLTTYVSEFHSRRTQQFSETLAELRQVRQQIQIREDQLVRTSILSPVDGIINRVVTTTLGGVVGPGDPIIEITPLDENLRVEGEISPQDVGFVFVGMPATVKLTAFDFAIYGTLSGKVIHIGADTVTDEAKRDAEPFYEVIVEVESQILSGPDGEVQIRPGMQATVELQSGERTVLEYLLKPMFRATEAFSER